MELRNRFYQKDVKESDDIFAAKQLLALATSSPPEFSDSSRDFVSDSTPKELEKEESQEEEEAEAETEEAETEEQDFDQEDLVVALEESEAEAEAEKVVPFSDFDYVFTCTVIFITMYFLLSCFTFLLRPVDT